MRPVHRRPAPYPPFVGGDGSIVDDQQRGVPSEATIIVCGHSDCGAMKGVLDPGSVERLPHVENWLDFADPTRRIVKARCQDLEPKARLTVAVQENVLVQLDHLRKHPAVAASLAWGNLSLYGWVYAIESGMVFIYDPRSAQFHAIDRELPTAALESRVRPVQNEQEPTTKSPKGGHDSGTCRATGTH